MCRHSLVDVKYRMVPFANRSRDIAVTMAKFQIPALTYKGHGISGTAVPPANDPTCDVLQKKENEEEDRQL